MKLATIAVVLAVLVAVALAGYCPSMNNVTFEQFLSMHEKPYANANDFFELETRRQIFEANMESLRKHNARYEQGLETWWQKVTQFADLTTAEFEKNHLGFDKSTQGHKAAKLTALSKFTQLKAFEFEEIDWSDKLPKSVDQGACGSCWANAAATTLFGRANIQYPDQKSPYPSRQQFTSCVQNPNKCGGTGGCYGATAQLAYDYLKEKGLTSEEQYPYTASDSKCADSQHTPVYKITGHQDILPNNRTSLITALKEGPVSVSAYASNWSMYGGGIFSKCEKYDINHAITLAAVGYDQSLGKYYYKIMNSWGSGWGENGYMRLYMAPPTEDEKCGIDQNPYDGSACASDPNPRVDACGCCGILYDSTIPVGITRV